MALKNNRKGVISLVDAMVFVSLISIVSVSLFAFGSSYTEEEPLAKELCEKLVSIELKASDVFDTEDSEVYDLSTLIASQMRTGGYTVSQYVSEVIDETVPGPHGYELTISTDDGEWCFQREGCSGITSEYETSIETYGDKSVNYRLLIYR